MKNRALRITLDIIASVVVLVVTMVLGSTVAGKIVGYTLDSNGMEKINGGGTTTIVLFTVGVVVTVAFAVWFYRFLSQYKIAKAKE